MITIVLALFLGYQGVAAATFLPNFLKFWTLLLILSCLGVFKIPELYLSYVTNLNSPEFDLSSIVYQFRRLNDIKLQMLLTVELNIFIFFMVWFCRCRRLVEL